MKEIVTRPYDARRFTTQDGQPLSLVAPTEIEVRRVELEDIPFISFEEPIEQYNPSELTSNLIDKYNQKFGQDENRPNIYAHIKKMDNCDPVIPPPSLQIFTSDVNLGNLKRDGFYRMIIEGSNLDQKKIKKGIKEITRLTRARVISVIGIFSEKSK